VTPDCAQALLEAIEEERADLGRNGLVRSDAVTFEVARSADMIFMAELLVASSPKRNMFDAISSNGG